MVSVMDGGLEEEESEGVSVIMLVSIAISLEDVSLEPPLCKPSNSGAIVFGTVGVPKAVAVIRTVAKIEYICVPFLCISQLILRILRIPVVCE